MGTLSLHRLVLSLLLVFLSHSTTTTTAQPPFPPSFKCTTTTTCTALVGYKPSNSTTLATIQSLFQIKTYSSLLGVNNFPNTTPPNQVVSSNQTVRIPFPCRCNGGKGLSNKVPQYTVVKDDWLSTIATQKFGGLVTYQQIQAVNNIPNPNLILVNQTLWIPLPCSCDDVDGKSVVHYGHVVAQRSSVDSIADEFGTTSQTLMSLNGITDPKKLLAGQVLDVPLKVCSSSINSSSLDYPLLVANNSYALTANNCVMCKCHPTNNFTLQCQPSGSKSNKWATCPALQCSGDMLLGNSTNISSCSRSTCSYTGYTNQTILTNLVQENTCPAPASERNGASKINLRGYRSLAFGLLFIQLLILLQIFM